MRYLLSILFVIFYFMPVVSGQPFHAGLMPELSVSYTWSDHIQQTLKIESAHDLYHHETGQFDYSYDQTDIQLYLEGRINPFFKTAGGYQYRLNGDGDNSHRMIQQVAFLQRKTGFRLGHRLRTDQTINSSDPVNWRFRYRLSAEIPLEGQSLDAGEIYLLLSGEPIYSLQDASSNLEARLTTSLGYSINNTSNLEMGLDYRMTSLLDNLSRQIVWLRLGWYYHILK